MARLGRLLLALALVLTLAGAPSSTTRATGTTGPIQLGGDDQNDHGDSDLSDHDADPTTPDVVVTDDGWKYVMLSLKEMLATEQRAGADNSIAVIGTDGSSAYVTANGWTENDGAYSCTVAGSSDSYCMMEAVKTELDRLNGGTPAPTVTYYETAAEVTAFFDGLTSGTVNVAVIFFPGDGGENDLDDGATSDDEVDSDPAVTSAMEQALIDSAADIAAFNAAGGGVLSSGTDHYRSWLTVLLPELSLNTDDTCVLGMTTDGSALWVGLTDSDISECWHNHFTGTLGALKVLAVGYTEPWIDADGDNMIDAGEATPFNWDGPDATPGTADDAQTIVIIGGAAGEAAIGEELPETNREGDALMYWLSIGALLTAGTGLMLRGRKTA